MTHEPNTREVVMEGLRQALQARVALIWSNVTLAGETNSEVRFEKGLREAIRYYEYAWKYIDEITTG